MAAFRQPSFPLWHRNVGTDSLGSWFWQHPCLKQSLEVIKLVSLFFLSEPCKNPSGNSWCCLGIPGGTHDWLGRGRVTVPSFHPPGNGKRSSASSPWLSQLSYLCSQTCSFPPSEFPAIATAPVNLQTSGFEWFLVGTGSNGFSILRHSSGATSLSIYSPSFRSQGTGLLLSCGLLWAAMCCKYNILLSSDGTVTQFRIWRGGQDPKAGFPVMYACSGLDLPHTEIYPTSELPQQLSMLCSIYWCRFTYA